MPTLTIATCQIPAVFSQEPDDTLLQRALHQAGITCHLVAWDHPTYDWSEPDLVLIRSTWDYAARHAHFLSWVSMVARSTTLWHPAALVRWNAHKTYLLDLHTRGIPIIPTVWLPAQSQVALATLMRYYGWSQVVIKPVVGTGSRETQVVSAHAVEAGHAHLSSLLSREAVMLQPFLPSFYATGEHALIFINGVFTHAVRKRFSLVDGLDQMGLQEVQVGEEERTFAEHVLSRLSMPPLFARVDLVRDHRQNLVLNELEVIEPVLYLSRSPQALQRLTYACRQLVRKAAKQPVLVGSQGVRTGLSFVPLVSSKSYADHVVTAPLGSTR